MKTNNEAFEKWFDANRELYDDNSTYDLMQIAWVAAKQETAKEIAELKVELEIAQGDNVLHRYRSAQLSQEITRLEESLEKNKAFAESDKAFLDKITELQSQVNILREALEFYAKRNPVEHLSLPRTARESLSATAKQSLIEHDNEVLERAAKVANGFHDCDIIADAIRELKEVKL